MTFNQPAQSSGFLKAKELKGHLILVTTIHGSRMRMDTMRKEEVMEIELDYVDLDGTTGELEQFVQCSYDHINSKLRPFVGIKGCNVLGRVVQLPPAAGMTADKGAFILQGFEEADAKKAQGWLDYYASKHPAFAQPAQTATPAPAAAPTPAPALPPWQAPAEPAAAQESAPWETAAAPAPAPAGAVPDVGAAIAGLAPDVQAALAALLAPKA
jgi:hypothetical protein